MISELECAEPVPPAVRTDESGVTHEELGAMLSRVRARATALGIENNAHTVKGLWPL